MGKKSTPKISNNNTTPHKASSGATKSYKDELIGPLMPVSDRDLKRFAEELREWVWKNRNNFDGTAESAVRLNDYYNAKKQHKSSFYRWAERCPELKDAMEFAVEVIASHRERGSMIRKYDSATILRTLARYDAEDRRLEKWRTNLKAKATAKAQAENDKKKEPTVFNINMTSYKKNPPPQKDAEEDK